MAFAPTSSIQFFNVEMDNTYQHQRYFKDETDQNIFFSNPLPLGSFTEYTTVRKNLPDGGVQSSVMVDGGIEKFELANYMRFKNSNLGDKWIYAFITKKVYINEECTEIVFETDVIQTWLFDFILQDSFVEREHSATDKIGDNLVPESFNISDYLYFDLIDMPATNINWSTYINYFSKWGYLVGTTDFYDSDESVKPIHAGAQTGIYQGLDFYYYEDVEELWKFINGIQKEHPDSVVFITVIPYFTVSTIPLGNTEEDRQKRQGFVQASASPTKMSINLKMKNIKMWENESYTPKNNKMWTSPFLKLCVTNHSDSNVEYAIEDFTFNANSEIEFKIYGDISASPSLLCVPCNYKGIAENLDFATSISNFPQCSLEADTYKLWLAKNQFANNANVGIGIGKGAAGVAMIIGGLATSWAGGSALALSGVGMLTSGGTDIFNTIKASETMKKEADKYQSGSTSTNLLTALKQYKFEFQLQYLKKDQFQAIDNYFTMYGYQTNKLKKPNISARKYFNYIKTIGCNIKAIKGIPGEDLTKIKSIFDKGVTFWKKSATIGNYSVDNVIE